MQNTDLCPCGSGAVYAQCCGRYHSGAAHPETAEQLMRSRFTAFALRDEAYLLATWTGAKRPRHIDFSKVNVVWTRLEIVSTKKGGVKDTKGQIQFKAYYEQKGAEYAMNELSRFRKVHGRWYYLDGAVKSIVLVGHETVPCPCGSGKVFEHCCGK